MATILWYGKSKFSNIHPQMSSDALNMTTVHPPPPPPPDALYVDTLFHRASFTYLANTNVLVRQCDR